MKDRVLYRALNIPVLPVNIVLAKTQNSKFKVIAKTNGEWKYNLRDVLRIMSNISFYHDQRRIQNPFKYQQS